MLTQLFFGLIATRQCLRNTSTEPLKWTSMGNFNNKWLACHNPCSVYLKSTAGCASASSLIKGNHKRRSQRYVQPNTSYCLGVYLEDLQHSAPSSALRRLCVFSDMIRLSVHFSTEEQIVSPSIFVNSVKVSLSLTAHFQCIFYRVTHILSLKCRTGDKESKYDRVSVLNESLFFYLHWLYVKSGKTALVLLLGCSNTVFISILICQDLPLLLHRNPGVTVWTGSPHCQGLNLLNSTHARKKRLPQEERVYWKSPHKRDPNNAWRRNLQVSTQGTVETVLSTSGAARRDNSCQRAMRKTMELCHRLRDLRGGAGWSEATAENTQHLWGRTSDRRNPTHTQTHKVPRKKKRRRRKRKKKKPELHVFSTVTGAAESVLTVLRNWISSSPSPPSAMAAKEPVQTREASAGSSLLSILAYIANPRPYSGGDYRSMCHSSPCARRPEEECVSASAGLERLWGGTVRRGRPVEEASRAAERETAASGVFIFDVTGGPD